MELVLLFAFAVIVAILFNWGGPKFSGYLQSSKYPRIQNLQNNYAGKTLVTALVFFAAMTAGAFALSMAGKRPHLPAA